MGNETSSTVMLLWIKTDTYRLSNTNRWKIMLMRNVKMSFIQVLNTVGDTMDLYFVQKKKKPLIIFVIVYSPGVIAKSDDNKINSQNYHQWNTPWEWWLDQII